MEVINHLGWTVLAPAGQGSFRTASMETIRGLDPDWLIFSDPEMRETLNKTDAWASVRAVREGYVLIAPSLPFGRVEEPPSINRLLGLAWLSGHEPAAMAAMFHAIVLRPFPDTDATPIRFERRGRRSPLRRFRSCDFS